MRFAEGSLMLTVARSQRKIYEIYDRQMFSAIGRQADMENIRLSAIQMAHQEGFERSPDDVSMQRLVGFSLSPALKKAFGDQFSAPYIFRGLFCEMGPAPAQDLFVTLNYDGEFRFSNNVAVIAGSPLAEERMLEALGSPAQPKLSAAIDLALEVWVKGAMEQKQSDSDDEEEATVTDKQRKAYLKDELKTGKLEIALLERRLGKSFKFHLLGESELEEIVMRFPG